MAKSSIRLSDRIKQEEQENIADKKNDARHSAVQRIISVDGEKDKQISAKVNSKTYAAFQKINRIQGLSNNSVLNQLIYKYVRENKGILENDEWF